MAREEEKAEGERGEHFGEEIRAWAPWLALPNLGHPMEQTMAEPGARKEQPDTLTTYYGQVGPSNYPEQLAPLPTSSFGRRD